MNRRPGVEFLLVVLVATVMTAAMTYPLAFRMGSLGRVDTSDGEFSIWNVAWVAHALVTNPSRVFDANIFYPNRFTLAYSEANLFAGLLAVPAYWATGNPHTAHNSAVLIGFVLTLVGTYYLARYLTGSRGAAAVAAPLFAFCPYIFARTAHIQLLMTAGLPFTLLAFHRLVDAPRPLRSAVLGLTLAATALACGYYGVFAGLIAVVASAFYLVSRRYWKNGAYYAALACAAIIAAIVIWPFFEPYQALQAPGGTFRDIEEARTYSANWMAYAAADGWGNAWFHRALQRLTDSHFQEVLFPGFLTVALAGVGLGAGWAARRAPMQADGPTSARRSETVLFYGLLAGLAFWLSFGPSAGLHLLLWKYMPGMTMMRAPARVGVVVTLALVAVGSVGVAAVLRGRRRAVLLAVALSLVGLLELAPLPLSYRQVPPVPGPYRLLAHLPDGPVAEFPFFYLPSDLHRHAHYMLNSTTHWKPLVNGYSDYFPSWYRPMLLPVSSFPSSDAFRLLQRHSTRYVIIHPNLYDHRSLEKLKDRLEEYKAFLRRLDVDDTTWLYEIVAWPLP